MSSKARSLDPHCQRSSPPASRPEPSRSSTHPYTFYTKLFYSSLPLKFIQKKLTISSQIFATQTAKTQRSNHENASVQSRSANGEVKNSWLEPPDLKRVGLTGRSRPGKFSGWTRAALDWRVFWYGMSRVRAQRKKSGNGRWVLRGARLRHTSIWLK